MNALSIEAFLNELDNCIRVLAEDECHRLGDDQSEKSVEYRKQMIFQRMVMRIAQLGEL